ncbi:MAG: hypothetical protein Q6M04_07055 [Thermostichus sp. BF3_bins_97]
MTPEQESLLVNAVGSLTSTVETLGQTVTALSRTGQNHEVLISEIREGQAMLAQYFRETLDRFDARTRAIERRTDEMSAEMQAMRSDMREVQQEIRDLRRDFLEFLQK